MWFRRWFQKTSLTGVQIVNGSSRAIGVGPSWAVHIDGGAAILKSEHRVSDFLTLLLFLDAVLDDSSP